MTLSSREDFLRRIKTIDNASSDAYLIDRALTDQAHNDRARLLRNGLMVVAFTSLEDFIRARTGDLLDVVSRTVVRFSELPSNLQRAATAGALNAVRLRAEMARRSGEDPIPLLQEVSSHIASTAGGTLQISQYSLAYSGSNVSSVEISDAIGAFNAGDAWNEITSIANRCGAGGLPLKDAYDQATQLRHSAAHRPDADIQPRDLQSFCQQAIAIALGFDIIASRAARLLRKGDAELLIQKSKLATSITLRFLDCDDHIITERKEGRKSAVRISRDGDIDSALKKALLSAEKNADPVILRDSRLLPFSWRIPDAR